MDQAQQILHDWLASEASHVPAGTALIPERVIASLTSILAAEQAGEPALVLCQATLSALFRAHRQSARAHAALLAELLARLGTVSTAHFWNPAVDFLNMAPDLGQRAIAGWVELLHLSPGQEQQLRTELFHALR